MTSRQDHSLVCGTSSKPMDGLSLNLHQYITETSLRANLIFVTLTSFSKSLSCYWNIFEPVDGFLSNLHRYIIVQSLRVIICKHQNQVKMTCLRFARNFVSFLFMSNDDRKWKCFFSETVRFHCNKDFLF